MSSLTRTFFTNLGNRGYEPLLHSVAGTVRCDIANEGCWLVIVNHGQLTVIEENTQKREDASIQFNQELFERIIQGQSNLVTTYMRGEITGAGNIGLLQIFQRLFPDPEMSTAHKQPEEQQS